MNTKTFSSQKNKVVVIGQGYVGLPLALLAIEAGFDVVGYDIDEKKITKIREGISYIESVPEQDIKNALYSSRYLPSSDKDDLAEFDIALITVPTPLRNGLPDLSSVEGACEILSPIIQQGSLIILESTTYPGATEELVIPFLEKSGLTAGIDFLLGFSPERVNPGNEVYSLKKIPKVVSGIDKNSTEATYWFWNQLVDTVVKASSPKVAEFSKLLENTFRLVNISMINELAMHANSMGIDIWEAVQLATSKPYGFMPFWPGPGAGGHCIPIDPHYLAWQVERKTNERVRFIDLASQINSEVPSYIVRRVVKTLQGRGIDICSAKVLVIGVAYKENIADARESPSFQVIDEFRRCGAQVIAHDPLLDVSRIHDTSLIELSRKILAEVSAVVLLVKHSCIDYDLIVNNSSYIFDARNCLSGANVEVM